MVVDTSSAAAAVSSTSDVTEGEAWPLHRRRRGVLRPTTKRRPTPRSLQAFQQQGHKHAAGILRRGRTNPPDDGSADLVNDRFNDSHSYSRLDSFHHKTSEGDTELHIQVREQNCARVRSLISKGLMDINATNHRGLSPLSIELESGTGIQIQERLLGAGADPLLVDSLGRTTLMLLCKNRHKTLEDLEKFLQVLKDAGAKEDFVNKIDRNGHTALVYAARDKSCGTAKMLFLLNNGANPAGGKSDNGFIMLSCLPRYYGQAGDVASRLLTSKEKLDLYCVDRKGRNVLHRICYPGWETRTLEEALTNSVDPFARDKKGELPIMTAAKFSDLDKTFILLRFMTGLGLKFTDTNR